MKKVMTNSIIFLIIGLAFNIIPVFGGNVKLLEKIKISKELEPIGSVWAFCVTQDELFMIPDYKAGNIKIYETAGENDKKFLRQVKIIGSKGYGPGELQKPTFCFYSKDVNKFVVMDHGIRKIFIYDRIGRLEFKRVKEVYCLEGGTDIQLNQNKLLIAGNKTDQNGNPNDLYYIDIVNDETQYLLPSYCKYGLQKPQEYKTQYLNKPDTQAIGIKGMVDIQGNNVYFVWEGDLKIIKINLDTRQQSSFGEKTSHYIKPFASKRLIEGKRTGNFKLIRNEWDRMSYITSIIASPKYVLVIYKGPIKQDKSSNIRLQFYRLDGYFIEELPIPDKPGNIMYFDKKKDILYSLSSKLNNGLNREYFILEYKIIK